MSWERENVEWPVDGDEMPLVTRCKECGGWYSLRALACGAEDTCVQVEQSAGQPADVVGRCSNHNVEILCKPLTAVCLNCDATNCQVVHVVARKGSEELAGIESARLAGLGTHWPVSGFLVTAARPTRSSAATAFQLNASSKRSDIGRRRAASTVSGTASG